MNLFTKQKQTHRKQTYGYQRGKGRRGDKSGIWDKNIYYYKQIDNQWRLTVQGNYTQYLIVC